MAGGSLLEDNPGVAVLFSMWVDPEKRRSGLGLSLIESVVEWARERGAYQIELWMTRGNGPAMALYHHAGFSDAGEVKRLPSNEDLEEILMRKQLCLRGVETAPEREFRDSA